MKTLETILNEYSKEVTGNDAETFENLVDDGNEAGIGALALNIVKHCHDVYASQFHPTPTEAEINEAADIESRHEGMSLNDERSYNSREMEAYFRSGFITAFKWLQNYQQFDKVSLYNDTTPVVASNQTSSNYQTDGREKPVIDDYSKKELPPVAEVAMLAICNATSEAEVPDYFRTQFVSGAIFGANWQASQQNTAIALIEAQLNYLSIQRKIANAFDLHAIKHSLDILETILKQIKP